ncbi:MAG: DUF2029 domain-containing protein [Candidatus Omnitrophica bacterium]|nr:DUF2029 domain-containing protein [Candidatus Omnitrophota bacterium]
MSLTDSPQNRLLWSLAIAIFALVFYRFQFAAPLENSTHNDFKHLYLGGRLLWRGEDPYLEESLRAEASEVRHPDLRYLNPYVYPPFTGYLFGWLGRMDYERATQVWFWFNQACLIGALLLLAGGLSGFSPLAKTAFLLGSVCYSFPLYRAIDAGQLDHFLLLMLSLILFLWRNGWKKSAAAVIALATLVKVVPGFLGLWLLWKREWPALGVGIFTGFLLILGPGVVFGLNPYFDYLPIVLQMGYGSSTWAEAGNAFYVDPGNIGFPALVFRLFHENPRTEPWLDLGFLAKGLCYLWGLGILIGCLASCRIQRRDEDPEMELGVWILGMLLIPSLFWDHYLILALPAWVVLASRLAGNGVNNGILGLAAACWATACVWVQWANPAYLSGSGMLMLNLPLPGVLILFALGFWMAKTGRMPEAPARVQL